MKRTSALVAGLVLSLSSFGAFAADKAEKPAVTDKGEKKAAAPKAPKAKAAKPAPKKAAPPAENNG